MMSHFWDLSTTYRLLEKEKQNTSTLSLKYSENFEVRLIQQHNWLKVFYSAALLTQGTTEATSLSPREFNKSISDSVIH